MMFSTELWPLLIPLGMAVLIAGFVQSLLGFGYAITALSMLPYLLNARDSHLVVSLSGVPPLILAAYAYRQQAMLKPLVISLAGALLLIPAGILVFHLMPLQGLVRLTGIAIFFFALLELFGRPHQQAARPSDPLCFLAGAVSGFLSGAVSIGGPPIVTFAIRQSWPPESFRFFVTFFLLVQAVLKVCGLAVVGFFEPRILRLCVWSVPFALLGVYLGTIVARHMDARRYRHLVALALIVSSISLIFGRGKSSTADAPEVPAVHQNDVSLQMRSTSSAESHNDELTPISAVGLSNSKRMPQ